MKQKFYSLFIFISVSAIAIIFLFGSCSDDKKLKQVSEPEYQERLINLNKALVDQEQDAIIDYIKRYRYSMEETKTGLHIMHTKPGEGVKPDFESWVTIAYKIFLLDGSYCYSSDSSGLLTFQLGHSTEPGGLQEGVLSMKEGGKALMIVPSYLAYGVTGDGNKISSNQSLVYIVELLKVK
jgi:FKBP-type peptidyl-prolyl cis-trans isomerase FkpA